MTNEFDINIDSYIFHVEVLKFYPEQVGKFWGPWEDCYPDEPAELEWECNHVLEYLEDDTEMHYNGKEAQDLADEYAELLEEKVMVALEEMKNESEEYYD